MGPQRVKGTQLSAEAWGVVLDGGRRADVPARVWEELRASRMAQGDELTPMWQQLVAELGAAPSVDVLASRGEVRFQTTIDVLGGLCLLHTRRQRRVDDSWTQEPKVLVQIADLDDLREALAPVLPPELNTAAPSAFDILARPVDLDSEEDPALAQAASDPRAPEVRPDGAPEPSGWLTPSQLEEAASGESLTPDEEALAEIAAALAGLDGDHEANEAADRLAQVPGVDPRLVHLLREAETEVTVTRVPCRRGSAASAEEALEMISGLAIRHWVLTDDGLVACRLDRSGMQVRGVEGTDIAREITLLIAGELPDPTDLAALFDEEAS